MDLEFNINDAFIENHPLNIFTKLYLENKDVKVYKECLENEIEDAIKVLSENLDDDTLLFLKMSLDNYTLNDQELDILDELNLKDELKTRTYVANKIITGVYNKRFSQS